MRLRRLRGPLLGALLGACLACRPPGVLVAPSGEHRLQATAPEQGLTAVLTTRAWTGDPADLEREVTIVHLLVSNQGSTPILLAPGDFTLRDDRGFRYSLLDTGARFALAGSEAAESGAYDLGQGDDFESIAPIGEMPELALPWGVLQPGTQMRGYLFFEKFERTAYGGELVWNVETPDHRPLVQLRFELAVAFTAG